jgi:predicted transposase YbfD/YdcC
MDSPAFPPSPEACPLSLALLDAFNALPDPRVERTRLHRLADILLLSLAAFCCGAEGFEDIQDWAVVQGAEALRRDLGLHLDNGIPHHDTFRRVLARLEPTALETALHLVRHRLPPSDPGRAPQHVALDGKEVRGSHDVLHQSEAIMLLSAFATDLNLVIGQKKVETKSNEIPAAVEVLSLLDIQGAAVTADAMHCQRETAKAICERGADYLLAVKDNQQSLHQALIGLFETNRQARRLPMQSAQTVDKDHGRIEVRRGWLVRAADWLPEGDPLLGQWAGLTSVLCLECARRWTHRGQHKSSRFVRYFISSSSAASVEEQMQFARSHWQIENRLHWMMDVTFGEDVCRARTGHEAQNLATLRRTAAFLLARGTEGTTRTSVRGRKKTAAWSRAYLLRTLTI